MGKVDTVGKHAAPYGSRALIVAGGSSAKKSGLYDRVYNLLKAEGMTTLLYDKVTPNPLTTTAEEGARIVREQCIDVIVAIGGGSIMDAAKGIAFLDANDGDMSDEVWESLALAGTIGGMVINTAGVTLAHGMEHSVSDLKDAVHGVGLAAIEPACVEATCRYNRFKFGKVSRLIGGLTAEDCGPRLRSLLKRLNMDATLADLGIQESDTPWLAENCQKVSAGNLANTPGKMFCDQASLEKLYRAMLTGVQEDEQLSA